MTDPKDLIKSATTISEAATPGPFKIKGQEYGHWYLVSIEDGGDLAEFACEDDAQFFATARTLVPELAAALKESIDTAEILMGLHQVSTMAVACGLEPESTLDDLYKRMSSLCQAERERDEARAELTRTKTWDTPRHAPKNGESLRLWIDECDGFEHPDKFFAEDFDGVTIFRCEATRRSCSAALWRYADSAPRPADVTVARSHAEFEEDDA